MARYAALAIDAGARIVGGCCGNTPAHIAAMRRALDEHQRGPRPDLAAIEAALGKLVSPPAPRGRARAARPGGRVNVEPRALRFVATAADAGERLDRFLSRSAEAAGLAFSRTRLKALIEAGEVAHRRRRRPRSVAQDLRRRAHRRSLRRRPRISRSTARIFRSTSSTRTTHLIVIDKPAGLVVHPAPGHATGTLVQALIAHCGASLSGIGGVRRPGIVHRLDKDTSGLMVVAKTDAAHHGLAEAFADHGRSGSLHARISCARWGVFDAPAGTIDAPLGRHPAQPRKDGGRRRRQGPLRGHPLARRRGFRGGDRGALPADDRAHPPDPRPSRPYRPSADRRCGLRRGVQDQGDRC